MSPERAQSETRTPDPGTKNQKKNVPLNYFLNNILYKHEIVNLDKLHSS